MLLLSWTLVACTGDADTAKPDTAVDSDADTDTDSDTDTDTDSDTDTDTDSDTDADTDSDTDADTDSDTDTDTDSDTDSPPPADADGDGATADVDCDDTRDDVYPGATEVCDSVDNDCDGVIDTDAVDLVTWYLDADGDGYGDPAVGYAACEAPASYVLDATDCDDDDASTYPGAPEPDCTDPVDHNCDGSVAYTDADADGAPACEDCDDLDASRSPLLAEVCDAADVDEDCDGFADDADTAPGGTTTWYADADGDGAGAGAAQAWCDAPTGVAPTADDCDDGEAAINPSAAEVCDSVDNNCDGVIDADAVDPTRSYADADLDGFGDPAVYVDGCDAIAGYVADATDCDDTEARVNPGAPEQCRAGNDDDCDGTIDEDCPERDWSGSFAAEGSAVIYGEADGDRFGEVMVSGDFDGDGADDVAVGTM